MKNKITLLCCLLDNSFCLSDVLSVNLKCLSSHNLISNSYDVKDDQMSIFTMPWYSHYKPLESVLGNLLSK